MKKLSSLLASLLVINFISYSQTAFTPGNVVVLRVGNGSATLTSAATPVFLDEYSTATGLLVQSVALPTSVSGNNRRLTLSGTATSEGALTLSPNKQFLCLAGYDTTVGTASVSGSSVGKTIALVGAGGAVNTSTGINAGSGFNTSNIRGAVTNDGTSVWASGNGTSSSGGTYYLPSGAFTSSPVKVSTAPTNTRTVNIFGGQLYTSAASSTYYGISQVGTGLPTTSGQTTSVLPGFPGATTGSSPYAFVMFDLDQTESGVDVIYVADDVASTGIQKYSKVSGTWVLNGNIAASRSLRGLTLTNACGVIRGFATSDDSLFVFNDNAGYNQPVSGALTGLVGRTTNTVFRGVAFAPNTPDPVAPTATASNVTDAKCFGQANGTATINVNGGNGALSYLWSDNGTGATRNNLPSGNYSVTVTDQLGCTAVVSNISIQQPTALAVGFAKSNVSCFGLSDGGLAVSVTGGNGGNQFDWGGGITTQTRTNLAAGIYTVTVTDSKGCTATKRDTINQPALLTVQSTKGNITCGSTNNGFINLTVNGGNGGNTFLWNDNDNSQNRTGLSAGNYAVTVTDSKNCTAVKLDTIFQSNNLTVTGTVTNVNCFGQTTGEIDITAVGGTGVYTYNWGNNVTSADRTNLAAGTYSVTVSDNGGCTGNNSFTVTQPDSIVASATATNVNCFGANDGSILLTVSGGTPNFTFAWSGGLSGPNPQNVAPGSYSVTVIDNKACSKVLSVTVTQPDSLSISGVVTNVTSFGGTNGAIDVTVSGGTSAYDFDWGNGVTSEDRTNLAFGNYTVTVTDDKGCTKTATFTVSQPSSLNEVGEFIWVKNLGVKEGNLILDVQLKQVERFTVSLLSVNGQLLTKQNFENSNILSINVSGIASGVYILRIDTSSGSIAKRIAIVQ